MNVRHERDGVRALADRADDCSLLDHGAAHDRRRPELEQRHHVRVGLNRDHSPAARNNADEGDGSTDRSADVIAYG